MSFLLYRGGKQLMLTRSHMGYYVAKSVFESGFLIPYPVLFAAPKRLRKFRQNKTEAVSHGERVFTVPFANFK